MSMTYRIARPRWNLRARIIHESLYRRYNSLLVLRCSADTSQAEPHTKILSRILAKDLRKEQNSMVRPERFELPTFWFVARRSIQLS
jgi:hypothetical protein